MKLKISLTFLLLIGASVVKAEVPSWSKDQSVKHMSDKVIVVTCSGEGLAKDLSFQAALMSCNSISSNELTSEFSTKAVVVESEYQSPKLYSEVVTKKSVKDLMPQTEKEYSEKSKDGYVTYLQVKYDLSKAKIVDTDSKQEIEYPKSSFQVNDKVQESGISKKKMISGAERTFIFQMMPEKCRDYIIRGSRPRSFSCNQNPLNVMINVAEDSEIILRPASSSFLPKTIKINQTKKPASEESEVIDVVFDRN